MGAIPHSVAATDLTIAQAAELKQVSEKTIRRAISRGEIDARRIGPRLVRVSAASLLDWGRPLQCTGGDAE